MDYAKLVEVLDSHGDLVGQVLNSLLWQRKASFLNIVKQVFALHVVEDDEVSFTVLEEIDQLDDIFVLTHLQDFNLTSLLENLNWLHVSLFDGFDGSLGTCDFMRSQLDHAKLTLAQSLSQLIEVKEVGEAHSLEQHVHPTLLLLLRVEVEDARFVGRKHNLHWVESPVSLRTLFLLDVLHEGACKTVHHSTLGVLSVPVAEDFIAIEDSPVLLEPVSLGLQIACALHEDRLLLILD